MDVTRAKVLFAAILATLAEKADRSAPEGYIYMAIGANMAEYDTLKRVLLDMDLVTVKGYRMTLTEEGRTLGEKINKALKV